jgi:excisionase family DNA binding protein
VTKYDLGAAVTALLGVPESLADLKASVEALKTEIGSLREVLPSSLVSVPEAAARLGVSVATVRRLVKRGDVVATSVGRSVRVDVASIRGVDRVEVARLAREARKVS